MRHQLSYLLSRWNGWPRRAVALGCLLLAGLSVLDSPAAKPTDQRGASVLVLVAAKDSALGTRLTPRDVRLAQWPRGLAPAHALTTARSAVGHRLLTPIARGEPVTTSRLIGTDLAAKLDSDHVATTIETATDESVLVHPGDHVDLLTSTATDDALAPTAPAAIVIARDVLVLAVLPHSSPDASTGTQLIISTSRSAALVLATVVGSGVLAVLGGSP